VTGRGLGTVTVGGALLIACDDGPRTVQRSNDHPVRNLKAHRPRKIRLYA